MKTNNNIDEILDELKLNESEKQIFFASIRETKLAQLNDEIDPKTSILEMIKEEFE